MFVDLSGGRSLSRDIFDVMLGSVVFARIKFQVLGSVGRTFIVLSHGGEAAHGLTCVRGMVPIREMNLPS